MRYWIAWRNKLLQKTKWILKNISLLGSTSIKLIYDDPRLFCVNVAERIRLSKVGKYLPVPLRISGFRTRATMVSLLFDSGEYQKLEKLRSSYFWNQLSRGDKHKILRAQEKLQILNKIIEQNTAEPTGSGPPNVIFYLSNGLPYTYSGYTFRSHSTMKALQNIGVTLSAVARVGYPVIVGKFPKRPTEIVEGIKYSWLIPWQYPSTLTRKHDVAVRMLSNKVRETGANLIHTTTDFNNGLVVAEVARKMNIPWIYEVRGELESTWLSRYPAEMQQDLKNSAYYRLARNQEESCMRAANSIVVLSEVSRQQIINRGIDPSKITIVPNAISNSDIGRAFDKQEVRRELGLPNGILVGTVSSIVEYEGLDILLESVISRPELTVIIVGDGVKRPILEARAKELGIHERVLFTGIQPNSTIWKWYAALDVFVVPRRDVKVCRTVTPIKALMAQALGVPVVASDLPALREITGDLAVYVPPSSPEKLLAGILKAMSTPISRVDLLKWVGSHTWEANAEQYRSLYEQLLQQPQAPA